MQKYKVSISILFVITISFLIGLFYNKNIQKEKIDSIIENNSSSNNNLISVMLENEAGTGNYEKSNDGFPAEDYIFNKDLSKCVNGSKISFSEGSLYVKGNKNDRCYAYFDVYTYEKYCKYRNEDSLVCDILRKKDASIIYHDGNPDYEEMKNYELEAGDLSYRFTGGNDVVNNYVCFGSDDSKCPYDNLYRIIGFFKNANGQYETKLIKADFANKNLLGSGTTKPNGTPDYNVNGSFVDLTYNPTTGNDEEEDAFTHRYRGSFMEVNRYKYQENGNEETQVNWPTSLLNTIHLNYNFLNTFSKTWQNEIVYYKWHYKGNYWGNIVIADRTSNSTIKTTFDYEIGIKSDKTLTDPTKIGLMYISDYLYAAGENNWTKKPFNGEYEFILGEPDSNGNPQGTYQGTDGTDYRSAIDENWMHLGLLEWTITQQMEDSNNRAFYILVPGAVSNHYVGFAAVAIRPCFYLSADVKIKDGDGTKDNPYRLKI